MPQEPEAVISNRMIGMEPHVKLTFSRHYAWGQAVSTIASQNLSLVVATVVNLEPVVATRIPALKVEGGERDVDDLIVGGLYHVRAT